MSHNAYVRAGGVWNTLTDFHAAEAALLDIGQFKSINGDDGGTWAPAGLIMIGGAGLTMAGPFNVTDTSGSVFAGALTANGFGFFSGGAEVTGGLLVDTIIGSGTATFSHNVVIGTTSSDALTVNADATFAHTATFTGAAGFSAGISVALGATFGSTASFAGLITATDGISASGGSAFQTVSVFNTLNIEGGATLSTPMVSSATGRVVKRVTLIATTGSNSSAYGPANNDVVYVNALTADVTFTINNSGAVEGDEIRFVNRSATHLLTLNDASAGTFIALQSTTGQAFSCLCMFIGGTWVQISSDKL